MIARRPRIVGTSEVGQNLQLRKNRFYAHRPRQRGFERYLLTTAEFQFGRRLTFRSRVVRQYAICGISVTEF